MKQILKKKKRNMTKTDKIDFRRYSVESQSLVTGTVQTTY